MVFRPGGTFLPANGRIVTLTLVHFVKFSLNLNLALEPLQKCETWLITRLRVCRSDLSLLQEGEAGTYYAPR